MAAVTDRPKRRTWLIVAWAAYQQISGILAAFALAAFVSNFVDIDWRGLIATLLAQWDEYVRAVMTWLLHYLVTVPLSWIGWHVEVPLPVRDYLAAGLVLGAAIFREITRLGGLPDLWHPWTNETWINADGASRTFLVVGTWPPAILFLWPVTILILIGTATFSARRRNALAWHSYLLALTPLIYFGVLVAVNFLVL